MKIKIRLENGLEIQKDLSVEQLQKAEQSKQFRQANKNGIKIKYCGFNYYGQKNCYGRCVEKCKEQTGKRLDILSNYVNYLQTI